MRKALEVFITRTGAHELMITAYIFDHAALLRTYEIAAEIRNADGPSDGVSHNANSTESCAATA